PVRRSPGLLLGAIIAVGLVFGPATADAIPIPPTITNAFDAAHIPVNGTATLTFNISNPNAFPLTALAFTDFLPAGLVVAPTPNVSNTCGGNVTATAAAGT